MMPSIPPPPEPSELGWQPRGVDGQSPAASGGYPRPISPASFQQSISPASFQQQSPMSDLQMASPTSGTGQGGDAGFPQASARNYQTPRAQGSMPRPRYEDPKTAAEHEHTRMRNLGYHSNMDTLNTMSTHVSTKARNLHSQLRAKSPVKQSACC